MKKAVCLLIYMVSIACTSIVIAEDSPIGGLGWHWDNDVTLNGKWFWSYDIDKSYREQDGWAYIEGYGKIHYWLYDTYSYHDGDGRILQNVYIPKWIESMGYVFDFDNIAYSSSNNSLASSVKSLMSQRGCDVSVALINSTEGPYVVINNYDKGNKYYWTEIIPLIK